MEIGRRSVVVSKGNSEHVNHGWVTCHSQDIIKNGKLREIPHSTQRKLNRLA